MSRKCWIKWLATAAGLCVLTVLSLVIARDMRLGQVETWQQQVSPGRLSTAHAFLENSCAACHTAHEGPDPAKCVSCHANNEAVLQRQPTAFHADISSCRECHLEHRGNKRHPTDMDHVALAKIGLRQLEIAPSDEGREVAAQLKAWIRSHQETKAVEGLQPHLWPHAAVLNCATCHSNDDRHSGLFGKDCAQCHAVVKWTIPEFRHPSPRSVECAQCHQAPPSHRMMHFHMVSARVAGKPHAQVSQCYLCHLTTAWNDIRDVGWYKHH